MKEKFSLWDKKTSEYKEKFGKERKKIKEKDNETEKRIPKKEIFL